MTDPYEKSTEVAGEALDNTSPEDMRLITTLAKAIRLQIWPEANQMQLEITLMVAHRHCPLRLEEMVRNSSKGDPHFGSVIHDVTGIVDNLDRETGKLLNGFTPRFAVQDEE